MTNWTIVHIPVPLFHPFTWLGLTAVTILALAWLITHWPYKAQREWLARLPKLHERPMTNAFVWFALVLFPFWLGLLVLTLKGTFGLWFNPVQEVADAQGALAYRVHYLALVGLMTALAGLIGAPLAIHRLYTVERQTKAQEEQKETAIQGHITDRINKAVEGLGAEKKISRMGRAVTYETNSPVRNAPHQTIEWRDDPLDIKSLNANKEPEFGEWKVFDETVPNLEVRIGAIYALERIAQDSLRDHIQIMEILCAYIRENAKASDIKDSLPGAPEWVFGGDDSQGVFDIWREDIRKCLGGIKPRGDIQTALTVIGRRSRKQKELEWNDWRPFEEVVPEWPEWSANEDGTPSDEYQKAVNANKAALRAWRGPKPIFRLDLRGTDLRGADMGGLAQESDFSLASFEGAVVQGANFSWAKAQGANFREAQAQGANFRDAQAQCATFLSANAQCATFLSANARHGNFAVVQVQGADFNLAQAQGAVFSVAEAQGVNFWEAQVQGASFWEARTQGANFSEAQVQGANFSAAQVQGANFRLAQAQGADFREAQFVSASLKSCDLTTVRISQDQVNATFGDASTTLPDGIMRPAHWPDWDMPYIRWKRDDEMTFPTQWQKWQADKADYVPPEKPEDA